MDFKEVLSEIRSGLGNGPDTEALSRIRSTFDDPVFRAAWNDYLRTTNNFEERDECVEMLHDILRICGDGSVVKNNELTNVRFGIGLGGSMMGGSIIALGTAATAAFFVLPMMIGGLLAGACLLHTGRLSREEKIYKDIEARLSKMVEDTDEE